MRQIVSLLVAVAVFIATFLVTTLVSDYTMTIQVAGHTLIGTIPGLVLAAAFAVMSYRGGPRG